MPSQEYEVIASSNRFHMRQLYEYILDRGVAFQKSLVKSLVTDAYKQVCMYVCVRMGAHVEGMYVCMYAMCARVTCVCVYMYVYVCNVEGMYVCMYAYVCTCGRCVCLYVCVCMQV